MPKNNLNRVKSNHTGPKLIKLKKQEIDSLFYNFNWEALPMIESMEYLEEIKHQLIDYYTNYRVPLR